MENVPGNLEVGLGRGLVKDGVALSPVRVARSQSYDSPVSGTRSPALPAYGSARLRSPSLASHDSANGTPSPSVVKSQHFLKQNKQTRERVANLMERYRPTVSEESERERLDAQRRDLRQAQSARLPTRRRERTFSSASAQTGEELLEPRPALGVQTELTHEALERDVQEKAMLEKQVERLRTHAEEVGARAASRSDESAAYISELRMRLETLERERQSDQRQCLAEQKTAEESFAAERSKLIAAVDSAEARKLELEDVLQASQTRVRELEMVQSEMQAQIDGLSEEQEQVAQVLEAKESELQSFNASRAAAMVELESKHATALSKQAKEHAAEIAKLKEDHEGTLRRLREAAVEDAAQSCSGSVASAPVGYRQPSTKADETSGDVNLELRELRERLAAERRRSAELEARLEALENRAGALRLELEQGAGALLVSMDAWRSSIESTLQARAAALSRLGASVAGLPAQGAPRKPPRAPGLGPSLLRGALRSAALAVAILAAVWARSPPPVGLLLVPT